MKANNEKEFADAVNNGEESIEIEGDFGKKILRIKATGKIAWVIAIGAIGVAIVGATYPVPEPVTQTGTKTAALMSTAVAVSTLGPGATATAISIAVAAGGVGVLNKLRKYKVVSSTNGTVILSKK